MLYAHTNFSHQLVHIFFKRDIYYIYMHEVQSVYIIIIIVVTVETRKLLVVSRVNRSVKRKVM